MAAVQERWRNEPQILIKKGKKMEEKHKHPRKLNSLQTKAATEAWSDKVLIWTPWERGEDVYVSTLWRKELPEGCELLCGGLLWGDGEKASLRQAEAGIQAQNDHKALVIPLFLTHSDWSLVR